jgi:acetyl-CoA carboxylase biotin carboxyl carrier protein
MDIREIQNLIKFVAKSGATEVKLEMDDIKITIKTTSEGVSTDGNFSYQQPMMQQSMMQQQPIAQVAPSIVEQNQTTTVVSDDSKYIAIKSSMIGTLYRKASPDKPAFVEVGSTISKGDVVCVIEAMKLFNEIESEVSGKIVKVLVDDASPVEFDQPLFLVDPS